MDEILGNEWCITLNYRIYTLDWETKKIIIKKKKIKKKKDHAKKKLFSTILQMTELEAQIRLNSEHADELLRIKPENLVLMDRIPCNCVIIPTKSHDTSVRI